MHLPILLDSLATTVVHIWDGNHAIKNQITFFIYIWKISKDNYQALLI